MKSSAQSDTVSIGDLAGQFGLATHVLRHWEDMGLLAPPRDGAGRRRYGRDELVRVAVILRSQAAGMSLEQIAVLLDADAPERTVLRERLAAAATLLRTEVFPATPGPQCRECPFVAICPARSAGAVVQQ